MSHHAGGRHRARGRFNPVAELTVVVVKSAQPAVKGSAVLAASGGLVASFVLPAQAVPADRGATASGSARSGTAEASAAPAVAAPAGTGQQATTQFGVIGFTATAKPKPKPRARPAPRPAPPAAAQTREAAAPERGDTPPASRSVEREPVTVKKSETQTSSKPASGGVLEIAARYEGVPYRYGGTSPETGFDCSGYTQYVFNEVGISLPRTAEQQRQYVTPVSSPQPGDLVFFGAPAYHMGIYAGNGMMWDAPRSGGSVGYRKIWTANVTYGRP